MDQLAAMRAFRRVIDRNGFAAAAHDLRLSNGAVSKLVSRLEARLGARLINRTTRRLSLTEVGRDYYERCVRILEDIDEAERAATQLAAAPRGLLRVNAPMSLGIRVLGKLTPGFLGRYPDIHLDLVLNDRLVDLVEEGFDVAIRIGDLADTSLVARRLGETRRVVAAAPAYLARHGEPRTPADLADHNCLVYAYLQGQGQWRFAGPDGPVAVRVSGSFHANNGDVLADAAADGLGVILTPAFIVDDLLRDGRLVEILSAYRLSPGPVHALYPPARQLSPKVRGFVDFLVERLPAVCP